MRPVLVNMGLTVADRPIIFSATSMRALRAEPCRKFQTRRLVTHLRGRFGKITKFGPSTTPGYDWNFRDEDMRSHDLRHGELLAVLPYAVGDRLWCREAWRANGTFNAEPPSAIPPGCKVFYEADAAYAPSGARKRAAMHLPRWASRLTLTVTEVRVQRLQEITEADAIAEGVEPDLSLHSAGWKGPAVRTYAWLWDHLNADRGFCWESNPWVAVISWREIERRNIDEVTK